MTRIIRTPAQLEAIYGPAIPRQIRRRIERLRHQAHTIRFTAEERAKRLEAEANELERAHD